MRRLISSSRNDKKGKKSDLPENDDGMHYAGYVRAVSRLHARAFSGWLDVPDLRER